MLNRVFFIGIISMVLLPVFCVFSQTQTPAEFLGYELGSRFTPHHKMVAYFEHVAATRNTVTLEYYGQTNEIRPLLVAYVTSPQNQNRLEEIRVNNLRLAGLVSGQASVQSPAITWLSYGIHGNESSSMEAAMQTVFVLSDPSNRDAAQWLEKSVVIMDPCLNPDGRDRYANWYNQMLGRFANPRLETREHNEPWPGGRPNHYYFDLNRDWAWQTQVESRQRGDIYKKWMPHIHADFHEMFINNPYYFAPAAEPFHEDITPWQREFQTTIGRNHTRYFDAEGWLYYTRENFDLFYPSYGDTWPTFNGAIGMTYEKAGHGRAGTSVIVTEGDTLTLAERILHHHTAGLSTAEITAIHSDQVVREFKAYFDRAQSSPPGEYKTYIIKGGQNPDIVRRFLAFLDLHDIRYGAAPQTRRVSAHHYRTATTQQISLDNKDIVISAYQPKSVMVKVMMEPKTTIIDSLTYDITAWSLPYVFGLDAYATSSRINPEGNSRTEAVNAGVSGTMNEQPYAYIAKWNSMDDAAFLAALLRNNVRVRFSEVPFAIQGKSYPAGSLVLTRRGNERFGQNFDALIKKLAVKHNREVTAVSTGFSDTGVDLGSAQMKYLKPPRVAVLGGDQVASTSFGEIWHYFDQQLGYPVAFIDIKNLNQVQWHSYDVLVLPSGNYGSAIGESGRSEILQWVRTGGKIIAMEQAVRSVSEWDGVSGITIKSRESDPSDEEKLQSYENRIRKTTNNAILGGIFKTRLDNTHPLAFGYPEYYYTIKNGTLALEYLKDGWNVATLETANHRNGFVGDHAREVIDNSLVFGVRTIGQGQIVLMADNPLFRAFWANGQLLFTNAVFFVGQ